MHRYQRLIKDFLAPMMVLTLVVFAFSMLHLL